MQTEKPNTDKAGNLLEHKVLAQEGYNIHYFVSQGPAGLSNKTLVVFLHPAFIDHQCFDKQFAHFSQHYKVVAIDLLGHGLSKVEKAKDKIDASVKHIAAIMQREGYEKAHFVGVSLGTLIAQYFAMHHPDKVLSMVAVGGYDINAENKEVKKSQRLEIFKWFFKMLFSMNSFRRYAANASVSKPDQKTRFYELAQHFTRKSFTVMSGMDKVMQYRENVEINYPQLILCGDQDRELAKKMSKLWHHSALGSEYHLFTNAGHCANMDQPEEFNKVVMGFIQKHTEVGG